MVALPVDARRLRRGVPVTFLLFLILLSLYAFIACQLPTEDPSPEDSESADRHLYPENGEHRDGEAEFGGHPLQDTPNVDAKPLAISIPPNSTVIDPNATPVPEPPQLPFAPDGIRYGLLSHRCHGSQNPDCGPTRMYVSETLALAVFDGSQNYSMWFPTPQDGADGGRFCGDSEGPLPDEMPPRLQKYTNGYQFRTLQACAAGRVTVLMERADNETAQHHVEILNLPASVLRHPHVPTPTPTIPPAEVERAKLLKERFDAVTAKMDNVAFFMTLQNVGVACPGYATSKNFEITEKLIEKHQNAGLMHLLDDRQRRVSTSEGWAMIEGNPEQVEDYVEILEWAYDEFSKMIEKPRSFLGCK